MITGILSEIPILGSVGLAFVNGAINSFVVSAAMQIKKNIRLNAVSPGLVSEELKPHFPGFEIVPKQKIVNGLIQSVEGIITGKILTIYS